MHISHPNNAHGNYLNYSLMVNEYFVCIAFSQFMYIALLISEYNAYILLWYWSQQIRVITLSVLQNQKSKHNKFWWKPILFELKNCMNMIWVLAVHWGRSNLRPLMRSVWPINLFLFHRSIQTHDCKYRRGSSDGRTTDWKSDGTCCEPYLLH